MFDGVCTCSRTGHCTKMWWRLFTNAPREVFVLRSEDRCWSECFLGMLVGNSCMRILFGTLILYLLHCAVWGVLPEYFLMSDGAFSVSPFCRKFVGSVVLTT